MSDSLFFRAFEASKLSSDTQASSGKSMRIPPKGENPGDLLLLEAAKSGQTWAWDRLIRIHNRRILNALLAQRVPLHDAKDLAQEAWLRLIERSKSGQLEHLELPGLAITQSRYLLADRRRHDKVASARADAAQSQRDTSDQELTLDSRQMLSDLYLAFGRCSNREKQVFSQVVDNADRSYAEVGDSLGLSTQRVKQIVCDVRKKLRGALRK
jgi:RNA polymerase sigma factor (sigma-70 family)